MDCRDRQRGMLYGLAIGDALGAAVEFRPPGSFSAVQGFRDGGPHGLNAGEWTDDTSMALALADSIGIAGWDLNHQAECYLNWFRHGAYSVNGRCFDIGITTASSLGRFEKDRDARSSGAVSEFESGNGSIMRLAPVAIAFADHFPDQLLSLIQKAQESSLPTHASSQCLSACAYLATVLAALVQGHSREDVLDPGWEPLARIKNHGFWHSSVEDVVQGSFREKSPPEIAGTGYVVKSLEAALWAFHKAMSFSEAVLLAVNLGDDADTTGAVCGQLAGTYWGESGIPEEWRRQLARKDMLEKALSGLLK